MIHHPVKQGSDEWHDLRVGIPTASEFDRIITPAKWEPVKGDTRRKFLIELLAQRVFGLSEKFGTAAMNHGKEWEPIARATYESLHGVDVGECGICINDAGTIGASPDGFVGEEGSIEIKSPANHEVHLASLIDSLQYERLARVEPLWTATAKAGEITGFLRDHWIQTQGQMYVSGRKWTDLISNFARLPHGGGSGVSA